MNVLVTGGSGFLGLYLTEQLAERGDRVRVLSRTAHPRFAELGIEWMQGDIRDRETVLRACADCEIVYHVAAVPGIWGPWDLYYETNTRGTEYVIEGCRRHGVPKLVYTSSPSVVYDGKDHCGVDESYPYPEKYLNHYSHTKALAEQAVLAANGPDLATVALRPHLIWGPRDNHLVPRLIRRAKRRMLRRIDADNLVSMIYVENAVAGHLQAAAVLAPGSRVAGQAYFINEEQPVNVWNWIDDLLRRAGLPRLTNTISPARAYRIAAVLEFVHWLFRRTGEPRLTRFVVSQLTTSHYYSIERAKRDFDFTLPVTVEEGLQRLEPELRRLTAEA